MEHTASMKIRSLFREREITTPSAFTRNRPTTNVRVASERWDRQFDGELDDIPDEYRITGSEEAAERDSTIAVLVVEPGKEPYVKEIDSGLESLQHEVGGCIEAIYPYEDPVALVCNEEGKLEGLPLNRALRDEDGDIYDVVAGTFLVVGLTDDSFGSLTVEQKHGIR